MLIWEAIQSNIPLISKDENVEKYQSEGLVVIW
jgi:PIN domain nuclease of toxin-antitoxin system